MSRKISNYIYALYLLMIIGMLSGCSDMAQIEDRDFVLGIAISYDANRFQVIFQRPDLASLTGQGVTDKKELLVTYSGASFSEIKEEYARNAEKRLDFSHLKVIIIDNKIAQNKKGMKEFLRYIENDYEISRNTLVFYTPGSQKNISSKIGDELEQLYQNNPSNTDIKRITIGDMVNCLYQPDKVLVLPLIEISKDNVTLDGAGIFQKNQCLEQISEEELTEWNLLQGKGTKRNITLPEGEVIKIKEIKAKYQYNMTEGIPHIQVYLDGEAELIEEIESTNADIEEKLNNFLKSNLERQLNEMIKDNQIDYLNFYRKMSYKNRNMWNSYQGKQRQFLSEAFVLLDVNIKLELH